MLSKKETERIVDRLNFLENKPGLTRNEKIEVNHLQTVLYRHAQEMKGEK